MNRDPQNAPSFSHDRCVSGSFMGDVCVWDTLNGNCIGNRANVHVGPVRAIDMRRCSDGAWVVCSGGEDWRVCVSFFPALGSASAACSCSIAPTGSSFIIDSRVRSVCINPWTDDVRLCIVGSQTGRIFSISLSQPQSLICSLPLDSPDIDCVACTSDFVICCGRNGAISRVPFLHITTGALTLSMMRQLQPLPELPPVTYVCIDPTRMCILCLHGSSTITERSVSSFDSSYFRIVTNSIWAPPCAAAMLATLSPSTSPSSTSCLAADAGFIAVFGCCGDAALIRDGHSLQLLSNCPNSDRFYLCCCRLQDDSVLSGSAIRSNGTIYGFRVGDAGRGILTFANFGVPNRLGRCSALACRAVGPRDIIVCVGSISGTLVLYCGPANGDDVCTEVTSTSSVVCNNMNPILILKKLHGTKLVSCIHMKRGPLSGPSESGAYSLHLYSAGHDGCIVSTHLHIARNSSQVVAQQRVRNLCSAPIVAFGLSSSEGPCCGKPLLSFVSIQNGQVMHSSGTFSMPAPPTAVGIVDQHRFSALAAVCLPSTVILADICKGQVRALAADARASCQRIISGMHSDTINDIAFICYENGLRDSADSLRQGIICTVSTDGSCCICSIPISSADTFHVLTRLHADAHQASGSALLCVGVVWLGDHRALIVAGGAFSCVHTWLLHIHASENGGCANIDVLSHASHICNACDDEGKCVSAIHCTASEYEVAGSSVDIECCISACLNDGRVVFFSCLVSSQGSLSILLTRSPIRFSHAVLCVAADSHGMLFFGLSNGCLHMASLVSTHSSALGVSLADLSRASSSSFLSTSTSFSPSEPPSKPFRRALHIAGLNALLPLHLGFIMCGGEDGCLSLVRLGIDGCLSVHETRRVSDGAVKKLLLLRRRTMILERTIEVDVGVICHNQRAFVISAQLQSTDCATSNESIADKGSLDGSCRARITSLSSDLILDVGKSWAACIIGAAHENDGTIGQKKRAPVVVGGWGVQAIQL